MDTTNGAIHRARTLAGLADALGRAEQHVESFAMRIDPLRGAALLQRIRAARAEVDALQRRPPVEIPVELPPLWSFCAGKDAGGAP